MGSIRIIDTGLQSSVQDLGRFEHVGSGVPRSGAADQWSLKLGNRLLGNDVGAAAIEMTLIGGSFEFDVPCSISLTGAMPARATIKDPAGNIASVPHIEVVSIHPGSVLHVGRFQEGVYGYLCVQGGMQTPFLMGSRSALVALPKCGLGSVCFNGERIPILTDGIGSANASGVIPSQTWLHKRSEVRIVPSVHSRLFDAAQNAALLHPWTVSSESNRLGVRLKGESIPGEIPRIDSSTGILPGFIQIPPSGQPIIIGVDGPATGGYPVIASVIEADLARVAQCAPNETLRFEWIDHDKAVEEYQGLRSNIQHCSGRQSEKGP